MFFLITGIMGSGKTILMVMLAYNFIDKQILSNFKITLKNVKKLKISDLFDPKLHNVDIFLDEGQIYIDARKSQTDENIYFSNVLMQSRKRDIDIYLSTQMKRMIELRFRELDAYKLIKCKKIITNIINEIEIGYFKYKIYDIIEGKRYYVDTQIVDLKDASFYFDKYNTNELIYNKEKLDEFLFRYKEKNELETYVNKLVNQFKKSKYNIKPITKDKVHAFLIMNKKSRRYTNILYTELKILEKNNQL